MEPRRRRDSASSDPGARDIEPEPQDQPQDQPQQTHEPAHWWGRIYPHQPPYPPYRDPPTPPGIRAVIRSALHRTPPSADDLRRWRERRDRLAETIRADTRKRMRIFPYHRPSGEQTRSEQQQQGESSRSGAERSQHGSVREVGHGRGRADIVEFDFRATQSAHPDLSNHPFVRDMETAKVIDQGGGSRPTTAASSSGGAGSSSARRKGKNKSTGDTENRSHSRGRSQGSEDSGIEPFPDFIDPMDPPLNPMPPIPPLRQTPQDRAKLRAVNKKQDNMWSFGRRRHHPDERQQP